MRRSQRMSSARVMPAMGETEVTTFTPHDANSGIPIASLNPDADGDGKVENWEREVYDRIIKADTDNTGTISERNFFDFIRSMSDELKDAAKGSIAISTLNPDTDGDGKVEKWELEVFERIRAADADGSGSISVKEVRLCQR